MFAHMSQNALLNVLEGAKWVFVGAYVLSTIGVTVGVYWEGDQFPKEKQHRGWRLLICCLAADTFFTIMVFGIEGWVGHIQRNEIIALETRLASRSLSVVQVAAIVEKTKPFAGQVFETIPYWKNPESLFIGNEIAGTLIKAGWTIDQPKVFTGLFGVITGVLVGYDKGAPEKTVSAAKELAAALNDNGLTADTDENNNPTPTDRIILQVGIKP
jgi:hypothetical protein